MTIELNKFAKTSIEDLENMSEKEFYGLDVFAQIERYLILNGYTNHDMARKIVMTDIEDKGYYCIEFNVTSTKKRCRKPYCQHGFAFDPVHKQMKFLGVTYF